jgi:hypothetical protein
MNIIDKHNEPTGSHCSLQFANLLVEWNHQLVWLIRSVKHALWYDFLYKYGNGMWQFPKRCCGWLNGVGCGEQLLLIVLQSMQLLLTLQSWLSMRYWLVAQCMCVDTIFINYKLVVHIQSRFRQEFCTDRCNAFNNCYSQKISII